MVVYFFFFIVKVDFFYLYFICYLYIIFDFENIVMCFFFLEMSIIDLLEVDLRFLFIVVFIFYLFIVVYMNLVFGEYLCFFEFVIVVKEDNVFLWEWILGGLMVMIVGLLFFYFDMYWMRVVVNEEMVVVGVNE